LGVDALTIVVIKATTNAECLFIRPGAFLQLIAALLLLILAAASTFSTPCSGKMILGCFRACDVQRGSFNFHIFEVDLFRIFDIKPTGAIKEQNWLLSAIVGASTNEKSLPRIDLRNWLGFHLTRERVMLWTPLCVAVGARLQL
jgi:hypothetical protein